MLLYSASFFSFTLPSPPCLTLFPYTTLFRSLAWRFAGTVEFYWGWSWHYDAVLMPIALAAMLDASARSEEHTSELQSRGHLVCRLLLEKKKIRTIVYFHRFGSLIT